MATATATETRPKVSREVLEDRYEGLINRPDGHFAKAGERLHFALTGLYEGLTRQSWYGNQENDEGGEADGKVYDELQQLIREHIIRRVDELGLAR